MTRPLIGVTVSTRTGWRVFPFMAFNIWLAGGRAQKWQAGRKVDLDSVDGVIIGGGDDIAPTLYGGTVMPKIRLDLDRDALEKRIVVTALSKHKPILGICRGSQMLNIASGGNLHQDAYTHYKAKRQNTVLPRKRVNLKKDSQLYKIIQQEAVTVNALHKQSVDQLGKGFQDSGHDESGMIQAIESQIHPFAIGVQWHPEYLFYAAAQRRLFSALAAAAKKNHSPAEPNSF